MDFKAVSRNRAVLHAPVVVLLRHKGHKPEAARNLRSLLIADECFLNGALHNQRANELHTIFLKNVAMSSLVHVMGNPFTWSLSVSLTPESDPDPLSVGLGGLVLAIAYLR